MDSRFKRRRRRVSRFLNLFSPTLLLLISSQPPPTFRAPIDSRASLTQIDLPAVPAPHHGTSYNPSVTAHQELLIRAAMVEKKKIEDLDKTAEVKKRMDSAVEEEGTVNGMTVQPVVDDEEDERTVESEATKQKTSAMKTKAQRNKQKRVQEEVRCYTTL